MGNKLHEIIRSDGSVYSWVFYCPACNNNHSVNQNWGWNGSMDKPTFEGSVLVHEVTHGTLENPIHRPRCHSSVKDGMISYFNDCGHAMAGQTLEIPDWKS